MPQQERRRIELVTIVPLGLAELGISEAEYAELYGRAPLSPHTQYGPYAMEVVRLRREPSDRRRAQTLASILPIRAFASPDIARVYFHFVTGKRRVSFELFDCRFTGWDK